MYHLDLVDEEAESRKCRYLVQTAQLLSRRLGFKPRADSKRYPFKEEVRTEKDGLPPVNNSFSENLCLSLKVSKSTYSVLFFSWSRGN